MGGSDGDFDLVVVGGGMAGMVAAVRAAERGLAVAVLEKGAEPRYPCNTRWSGGILHIAYTDPKVPAAELHAAVARAESGGTDPALAAALIEDTAAVIDWLRGQGARFMRAGLVAWQNWMLAPPRPLVAGLDWEGRGPDVLLRQLGEKLAARGGVLRLGTRAETLIVENGTCRGVAARDAAGPKTFRAGAVVLADGGFQADLDMLRGHLAPVAERVKQRGAATGTGDGLRMARAAGAAITPLDRFYGHLLSRDSMHNDKVWPYPELDGIAAAGILVNAAGKRFVDEGLGGIEMANRLARSDDPLGATIVCDTAIWEGPGRSARIPANPQLERAGGTILRAPTLEELASRAGLPAEVLAATVAAYNAGLAGGTLSPPRSTDRHAAMPITAAPFLAIPVCTGITYTMGGIRIDRDARVLAESGAPIPGLYAAGATTGGIEGGAVASYIGGLSKAAVFGFRAAEHAAARHASGVPA